MTSNSNKQDSSANVSLITRFMQTVWNDGNPDKLDQFVSEKFVDHAYTPNNRVGHANMVRLFSNAFSHATHVIEQCTEQGDTIVIRVKINAQHTGTFREIAATGNHIAVAQYRTFRIAEGQIAEHRALFDTASLLHQIQATVTATTGCAVQ